MWAGARSWDEVDERCSKGLAFRRRSRMGRKWCEQEQMCCKALGVCCPVASMVSQWGDLVFSKKKTKNKKQKTSLPLHGKWMDKQWKQWQTLLWGAPKSLQMVTVAMKLKEEKLWPTKKSYDQPKQHIKSRDITLPKKVILVKAMVFPVIMHARESWTI